MKNFLTCVKSRARQIHINKFLIPTLTQWNSWSLPSKLTAVGTLVGILSIVLPFLPISCKTESQVQNTTTQNNHSTQLAYSPVDEKYIKRYLKERLAFNLKAEIVKSSEICVTWESTWISLAGTYRAMLQIREVSNASNCINEEDGWKSVPIDNSPKGIFDLVNDKDLRFKCPTPGIYEIRFTDYNYDSDDPPSIPLRFIISQNLK